MNTFCPIYIIKVHFSLIYCSVRIPQEQIGSVLIIYWWMYITWDYLSTYIKLWGCLKNCSWNNCCMGSLKGQNVTYFAVKVDLWLTVNICLVLWIFIYFQLVRNLCTDVLVIVNVDSHYLEPFWHLTQVAYLWAEEFPTSWVISVDQLPILCRVVVQCEIHPDTPVPSKIY